MASASAIAYVMTEKFQMGTPLYRLEQYWKSRGVDLNRNTLARWVIHGSLVFKPLINYLNRLFNTLRVAHCDETGFNVLKRDGTPMNKYQESMKSISLLCIITCVPNPRRQQMSCWEDSEAASQQMDMKCTETLPNALIQVATLTGAENSLTLYRKEDRMARRMKRFS